MLGALYGDVIGSYYELHCTKDYNFEFNRDSTFTDDSVLTAAVCRTILNDPCPITKRGVKKRALEYAAQFKQYYFRYPRSGFGNMFAEWAKDQGFKRNRSYGNGAAMRALPIGYAYDDIDQIMLQVKASCLYTHNHREAIKAAQAVAVALFLARKGESKEDIRSYISNRFAYDLSRSIDDIRADHVFDSRASYSVPPALIAFLDSADYESAVRNAVSLGGDADTQACIAGGIAEAYYKEIPDRIRRFCDMKIDHGIRSVVREFESKYN